MERSKTKKIFNTALALLALSAEVIDDSLGLNSFSGKKGIYTFYNDRLTVCTSVC